MTHNTFPIFSVVIPLYNKTKHISRALDSVLNQSYQNFEIIVIDDGSLDDGFRMVETYTDTRIKLIRQKNAGVATARNRGIDEASGEYIAFLDADDAWLPDFLDTIISLQQKFPEADVCSTAYRSDYEHSDKCIGYSFDPLPKTKWEGIIPNYFTILVRNATGPIWTGAVCVRKSLLLQVGGFDSSLKIGEDIDLWSRLFLHSPVAFSNQVKSIYYLDISNSSRELSTWLEEDYKFVLKMKNRLYANEIPKKYREDYINYLRKELAFLIRLSMTHNNKTRLRKIFIENFSLFTWSRKMKILLKLLLPKQFIYMLERRHQSKGRA